MEMDYIEINQNNNGTAKLPIEKVKMCAYESLNKPQNNEYDKIEIL